MRDRLIELMNKQFAELVKDGDWNFTEMLGGVADYLIENGVMCLPCTLGEKVYRISTKKGSRIKYIEETTISRIAIDKEGIWLFCSCNPIAKCVWGKTVFASREEAEKALTCQKSRQVEKGGV